ncbi:MAG: DUF1573 domain-containing protein [Mucinivorans sp.]
MRCLFAVVLMALVSCGTTQLKPIAPTDRGMVLVMPEKGKRQVKVDTIYFGRINEGEIIKAHFTVVNHRVEPLVITDIITGCGCTTVDYDPAPIATHEERTFEVRFDSKGRYGTQYKTIEVLSEDHAVGYIAFKAEVKAQ